jgi:hypothetical protein
MLLFALTGKVSPHPGRLDKYRRSTARTGIRRVTFLRVAQVHFYICIEGHKAALPKVQGLFSMKVPGD